MEINALLKFFWAFKVFVVLGPDQQVSWMQMRDSIHSSDPSLASDLGEEIDQSTGLIDVN